MNVRLVDQVANQSFAPQNGRLSPPIRRRLIELQQVADEIDLRAKTLEWMTDSFPSRGQDPDLVPTLRETAARLRSVAIQLIAPSSPEEGRSAEAS